MAATIVIFCVSPFAAAAVLISLRHARRAAARMVSVGPGVRTRTLQEGLQVLGCSHRSYRRPCSSPAIRATWRVLFRRRTVQYAVTRVFA